MITESLRELIRPYVKMNYEEENWDLIEVMLDNAIKYKENGRWLIALPPVGEITAGLIPICTVYDSINGAYLYIEDWEYVKSIGEKA